jgi:hypothetical protein
MHMAAWLDGRDGRQQPFFAQRPAGSDLCQRERLVFAGPEGKGICPCCDLAAGELRDGSNIVAFRNTDSGHRDICFARAPQDGSFGRPSALALDNWTYTGCPHDGPAVAVCANRVFAASMTVNRG